MRNLTLGVLAIAVASTSGAVAVEKPGAAAKPSLATGKTAAATIPGIAPGMAEVVLIIDGIDPGKGVVNVAFCNAGPLDQCRQYGGRQPAGAETLGFRFENIPPGRYAVVGYQDMDASGDNQRNMVGMPKEPFALGNGTTAKLFPPPGFEDLATPISEGPNVLRLTLRTITGTTKKKDVPTLPPEAVPLMLVELPGQMPK
jgi:uncharacterized protein (DUF2141 family)